MGKLMRLQTSYFLGLFIILLVFNSCQEDPYTGFGASIEFEITAKDSIVASNHVTVFETNAPRLSADSFMSWFIQQPDGEYRNVITPQNYLIWRAPADTGEYLHTVRLFQDFRRPISETVKVRVTVVPSPWQPADAFYKEADLLFVASDSLFLKNTDTGEERLLGNYFGAQWFTDGERIMAIQDDVPGASFQIVTMYADGTDKKVVYTNHTSSDEWIDNIYISPGGRYVVYNKYTISGNDVQSEGIFWVDLTSDDYSIRHLNQYSSDRFEVRDWSPDGAYFLVQSGDPDMELTDQDYESNIAVLGVYEFLENTVQDSTADVNYKSIRFSKNFQYLAYIKESNGTSEIFRSNPAGREETQITDNTFLETNVSWLPGSTNIVFTAIDTTNNTQSIYTIDLDGGDQVKITDSSSPVTTVEWRPVLY